MTYGYLERLFGYRTTLKKTYDYWVRKRKYKKELKLLAQELETLNALNDLLNTLESKTNIFKSRESKNLEQWKKIVNGAVILAVIEDGQEAADVIAECDKAIDLLDFAATGKERDLFFDIQEDLMRKYGNMNKEVLGSLQKLLEKAVQKRYLLSSTQKQKINDNIKKIKEAVKVTKDSDYLTSLLDVVIKEKEWDKAFEAFVAAFELFKSAPTKVTAAKFVAAFNNVWPNRPKDEKAKIKKLRKVFEEIHERDDILQTRAQKTTMQNWLEVLSRESY